MHFKVPESMWNLSRSEVPVLERIANDTFVNKISRLHTYKIWPDGMGNYCYQRLDSVPALGPNKHLIQIRDPNGKLVVDRMGAKTHFDENGRIKSMELEGKTTEFLSKDNGNPITSYFVYGNSTSYRYSADGRVVIATDISRDYKSNIIKIFYLHGEKKIEAN